MNSGLTSKLVFLMPRVVKGLTMAGWHTVGAVNGKSLPFSPAGACLVGGLRVDSGGLGSGTDGEERREGSDLGGIAGGI